MQQFRRSKLRAGRIACSLRGRQYRYRPTDIYDPIKRHWHPANLGWPSHLFPSIGAFAGPASRVAAPASLWAPSAAFVGAQESHFSCVKGEGIACPPARYRCSPQLAAGHVPAVVADHDSWSVGALRARTRIMLDSPNASNVNWDFNDPKSWRPHAKLCLRGN